MPAPPPRDWIIPPGYAAGAPVPWWLKFSVKLALGGLPVPPALWRAVGLRRHSFEAESSAKLLDPLASRAALFRERTGRAAKSLLEVGPGAMVSRAPVAAALGFGPIWFLDVEDAAPRDLAPYHRAAQVAREAGLSPPDLSACTTREEVLAACGATYLVGGTEQLARISPGSLDLVISEAVLEHVRRDAMAPLLTALARVMAPGGLALHAIDFHDHLGGALRHLGFSPAFWEGKAVGRAGLYCNRLGLSQLLGLFAASGLSARITERGLFPALPAMNGGPHPALEWREEDSRICCAAVEAVHA